MNKTLFNKYSLDISQSVIDKAIDAICSQRSVTRSILTEKCGTSISTVSKIARALIDSGTVSEKTLSHKATLGQRACHHLSVSRRICTAVIDLSSPIYSFDIICDGESYFRYNLKYNSGISFEDNLYSLLSHSFSQIRLKSSFSLSVCVIYSDLRRSDIAHAYLPGIHDKELIDAAVYDTCRQVPLLYVPKSKAIHGISKFNVVSKADGFGGVSYLSLGSINAGFYVNQNMLTPCKLKDIIIADKTTLQEFTKGCVTRSDFELLLERSVNFIDAAYGAQTLIIECDLFEIDASYIKNLERRFASMRLTLPDVYPIYTSDKAPSILVLSASRQAEAALIKSYVTGKK